MSSTDIQQWGLRRNISPCFGARLVQERGCLHFLADRAGFNGTFSDDDMLCLDQAFPLMLKQLELMLIAASSIPAISTASRFTTTDSPAKPIHSDPLVMSTSLFILTRLSRINSPLIT